MDKKGISFMWGAIIGGAVALIIIILSITIYLNFQSKTVSQISAQEMCPECSSVELNRDCGNPLRTVHVELPRGYVCCSSGGDKATAVEYYAGARTKGVSTPEGKQLYEDVIYECPGIEEAASSLLALGLQALTENNPTLAQSHFQKVIQEYAGFPEKVRGARIGMLITLARLGEAVQAQRQLQELDLSGPLKGGLEAYFRYLSDTDAPRFLEQALTLFNQRFTDVADNALLRGFYLELYKDLERAYRATTPDIPAAAYVDFLSRSKGTAFALSDRSYALTTASGLLVTVPDESNREQHTKLWEPLLDGVDDATDLQVGDRVTAYDHAATYFEDMGRRAGDDSAAEDNFENALDILNRGIEELGLGDTQSLSSRKRGICNHIRGEGTELNPTFASLYSSECRAAS